jgi:hypothetical protein
VRGGHRQPDVRPCDGGRRGGAASGPLAFTRRPTPPGRPRHPVRRSPPGSASR